MKETAPKDFRAYERVRVNKTADIYDAEDIALSAGISPENACYIMKHYSTYMRKFDIELYIPDILPPNYRARHLGGFSLSYNDLVLLYGSDVITEVVDGWTEVRCPVLTAYGVATIYSAGYNKIGSSDKARKRVRFWYVSAFTRLAYEVMTQRIYAFEVARRQGDAYEPEK